MLLGAARPPGGSPYVRPAPASEDWLFRPAADGAAEAPGAWLPEGTSCAPSQPSYDDCLRLAMEEAAGEGAPDMLLGAARPPGGSPYVHPPPELPELYYFQAAGNMQPPAITGLSQGKESSRRKIPQADALQSPEAPMWAVFEACMTRLENCMTRLEKGAVSMTAPTSKRKAKLNVPSDGKPCIEQHAAQDLDGIHSSGTSSSRFIQNASGTLTAHCPLTCNSPWWSGVAHTAYTNMPASHGMLAHGGGRGKPGINAARNALAFAGKKAAGGLLQQFPGWLISHFTGGG